ncbi:MAG TPA: CDP-alcohol phosphatidyltransferase family protein [Selenomonadales bacterium]|nr:CDP-alcohol phosphatidyltransferase family protein [Selenomonadales bacterium]
MLDTHVRKYCQPWLSRLAQGLVPLGLRPNTVTLLALAAGLGGAFALYQQLPVLALTLLWLSGLADVLDGTVARLTGESSPFGAFMDLIFDRVVEMCYILAIVIPAPEFAVPAVYLLCSIIFSFSIFLASGALIGKRSEKAFYYQAGLAERTETFLIFSGIMVFPEFTTLLLNLFTAMIVFTGGQRFYEVYRYFHTE